MLFALLACTADPGPAPASTTKTPTVPEPSTTTPPGTPTDTGTASAPLVDDLLAAPGEVVGSLLVVSWTQGRAADAHLEFSYDPGVWLASPTKHREAGEQRDLVLGAPYDSVITWRLVVDDGAEVFTSPDVGTANGPLPAGVPEPLVRVNDPSKRDLVAAPYWLVGLGVEDWSVDPWWVLIVDSDARVVWASRTPNDHTSMHARVARDGASLFLDRNSYWSTFDGGADSSVDQVDIEGTVLHTYDTPGLHHPFTDLPDGTIAYGSAATSETIRLAHPDGTFEEIFDCNAWLDTIGEAASSCASNTLTYDEATDKLLFSQYSINSIVEVDLTTHEATRWFGHVNGSYTFDPPNSAFWWQHGGYITDAGTLLTSSDRTDIGEETVVREYEIDEAAHTLHEIWNLDLGEGIYGGVMGEAVRLPNGNTAHNFGGLARLRESTHEREVVWDVEWSAGAIGRTMPIADLYALAPFAP